MESSEATATPDAPSPAPAGPMYAAVVLVGIVCGLAIVIVYQTTGPVIQRNRIEMRQQAIFDVLPGAVTSTAFRFDASGEFEPVPADSAAANLVFAGYDEQEQLVGIAIEAQGMGYQDVIQLLYGYSFEHQAVIGVEVLASRETPGLGDRIETDADFQQNFEALDVRLTDDGEQVLHPITFVKPGEKNAAWQIDGISGATISSQAVADILRKSTGTWIPRVRARRSDFESGALTAAR